MGVFYRKFMTSFLAHVKDEHLYMSIRRVDWLIPRAAEDEKLPEPGRNRKDMDFRVVTGDPIFFAGVQDLEIDWRNDVFRKAFQLPGSTMGEKKRREVLDSIPVPKEELSPKQKRDIAIEQLTPKQLRASPTSKKSAAEATSQKRTTSARGGNCSASAKPSARP